MGERLRNLDFVESQLPLEIIASESKSINLRLKEPMKLPFGEVGTRPSGILKITVRVGNQSVEGYGEGATLPKPVFTDDSGEIIAEASSSIVEGLKNSGAMTLGDYLSDIQNFKFPNEKRYPTARMMVEMALLDAYSKSLGISVKDLLGVPEDKISVPYGKSLGEGNSDEIIASAVKALEGGARKIKLKVSPLSYREVIKAVKHLQSLGNIEIMVDANGSFDPGDDGHITILRDIDLLGLLMIEEPVSRIGEHKGLAAVRKLRERLQLSTPICLDDCLIDLTSTQLALDENLADIINIKPGRIGSIERCLEIGVSCKERGKQVMVGGMLEATPGRCMTVTLASFFHNLGFSIPGDLSLSQERLQDDLVEPERVLNYNADGEVVIPTGPGWGFGKILQFEPTS